MKITINNLQDVYRSEKASRETMELKGYELIEQFFVDSSGLGQPDELALTKKQFELELIEVLKQYGSVTSKLTDVGQFQVYVGLFIKTKKSKAEKIANNTYFIRTDKGYTIRLYDTDIITLIDNKLILDSGGYNTYTTKQRMNEELKKYNIAISQKNHIWTVYSNPDIDGNYQNEKLYHDKMIIEL